MSPRYPHATLIHLPLIDSTNNYAMQLLDAEAAVGGTTIVADAQSDGKGQRGRIWLDEPGQSLLMSTILSPHLELEHQFSLSAAVAVLVAETLSKLHQHWEVRIKWPNDIIINDKKAGGILIENILRGSTWSWCIVGLGLNVLQKEFPQNLPFATSLFIESKVSFDVMGLAKMVSEKVVNIEEEELRSGAYLERYNQYLYRKNGLQIFAQHGQEWPAVIRSAARNGMLQVELADGAILHYTHGRVEWKWG